MIGFKKGLPAWPAGEKGTWNQVVGLHASLGGNDSRANGNLALRITAADCYRVWQWLRDDWGPMRGAHDEGTDGNGADLLPAALLYGLMLRFDLLQKACERERLVAELRHVFGLMARQTGTLWEHVEPRASLNHGFASYASALLLESTKCSYVL